MDKNSFRREATTVKIGNLILKDFQFPSLDLPTDEWLKELDKALIEPYKNVEQKFVNNVSNKVAKLSHPLLAADICAFLEENPQLSMTAIVSKMKGSKNKVYSYVNDTTQNKFWVELPLGTNTVSNKRSEQIPILVLRHRPRNSVSKITKTISCH